MGPVLREASLDLVHHPLAIVPANVLIGALLLALLATAGAWPVAVVLSALLVLLLAGVMRMSTCVVREGHADLGDLIGPMRHGPIALVALVQLAATAIVVTNIAIGLSWGSLAGAFLALSAAYGLAVGWVFSVVAWPILLDPLRDAAATRSKLRLAVHVLAASLLPTSAFAIVLAIVIVASAVLIMPLLTVSIGFAWLAAARFVLPMADRAGGLPPES
jgi:hypothetical protein